MTIWRQSVLGALHASILRRAMPISALGEPLEEEFWFRLTSSRPVR